MKDKTMTLSIRVSVKAMAILADYLHSQGVRTLGSVGRNALELLASHIQKECGTTFTTDEEAIGFLHSFGCNIGQIGDRKNLPGNLDLSFGDSPRTNMKESILAGIKLAKECQYDEKEGE